MRGVAPTPTNKDIDRFWSKVDKTETCWLFPGVTSLGYGVFYLQNGRAVAHRFAYEVAIGPIPDGLELDHLCRVRNCVNPAHLEPVTRQENCRRATVLITHCPYGHLYDEDNTYFSTRGSRVCRTCARERGREYMRAKSARRKAGNEPCPSGHIPTGVGWTEDRAPCPSCGRLTWFYPTTGKFRAHHRSARLVEAA